MSPELDAFVARVTALTAARLETLPRRHHSCVSPALGPVSIARRWRPERLPTEGPEQERLAERLVDWALGVQPEADRPFTDLDVVPPGS